MNQSKVMFEKMLCRKCKKEMVFASFFPGGYVCLNEKCEHLGLVTVVGLTDSKKDLSKWRTEYLSKCAEEMLEKTMPELSESDEIINKGKK